MVATQDISALFEKAQQFVRDGGLQAATATAADERELSLTLYGLYKQATAGRCDAPQPSYFDFAGRKKWQAWADCGDMAADEAKRQYVSIIDQRCPSWAGPARESELRRASVVASVEADAVHSAYFVTGATGFLGKNLLAVMLKRNPTATFYCLAFEDEAAFAKIFSERFGADAKRIVRVGGNITKRHLGMSEEQLRMLKDEARVTVMFHLAALYDLRATQEANHALNVEGTTYAVEVANMLGVEFNYVSTIVVAGDYQGTFMETMFDEGQTHHNPYYKTKFDAESIVRAQCTTPLRIYRPGIVIGSSETGEAEKIDGPYYMFDTIRQLRRYVPEWLTLVGIRGEKIPLVPVDYVVKCMDAIAHRPGCAGKTFHLVDPEPCSFLDVFNIFSTAAHGPAFSSRISDTVLGMVPNDMIKNVVSQYPKCMQWPFDLATAMTGVPQDALKYAFWATRFDCSATQAALAAAGTGITCAPLASYAWKCWDYYERVMVPRLASANHLAKEVRGRVCLVTGGDSGIGWAITQKLAAAGAVLVLVSFDTAGLARAKGELEAVYPGVQVHTYYCNLAKEDESTALPKQILADLGHVDVLVNCAGRSIRRSVIYATDRFHDFKRTIDLNYYGSLAMILGFLNAMRAQRYGRVINISSIGAQTNQPRFSAYAASKAALDSFSRSLNSEVAHENVTLHTVYMPLVKTKMIAPTATLDKKAGFNYYNMVAITPEAAADLVLSALTTGHKTIATPMGNAMQAVYYFSPELMDRIFNYMYKIEPEKAPEGMAPTTDRELYSQTMALVNLFGGLEF